MCVFVCVFTILNPLNYYRMSSINTHMYKNPTNNQHRSHSYSDVQKRPPSYTLTCQYNSIIISI